MVGKKIFCSPLPLLNGTGSVKKSGETVVILVSNTVSHSVKSRYSKNTRKEDGLKELEEKMTYLANVEDFAEKDLSTIFRNILLSSPDAYNLTESEGARSAYVMAVSRAVSRAPLFVSAVILDSQGP